MATEVIQSLSSRFVSLEDIIQSQESILTSLLQRLAGVEKFVGNEVRQREQGQQQLNGLLNEQSNGITALSAKTSTLLQSQSDRISTLQADGQGFRAALEGLDKRFDASLHGLDQKLQISVDAVYTRIRSVEDSNTEAMRTLNAAMQNQAQALQAVDTYARESTQVMQQQVKADLIRAEQRTSALETSMREALREVHGSLTRDLENTRSHLEHTIETVTHQQNASMKLLDDRVQERIVQCVQQMNHSLQELSERMTASYVSLQASLQSSHEALKADIASTMQFSQGVDNQQKTCHQMVLQELSNHKAQMEEIDRNWSSSVLELGTRTREDMLNLRDQWQATFHVFEDQLAAVQERINTVSSDFAGQISDLNKLLLERFVSPLELVHIEVNKQAECMVDFYKSLENVRGQLRLSMNEVEQNLTQIRSTMETAIRATHLDLQNQIRELSEFISLEQERTSDENVEKKINQALEGLPDDENCPFVTWKDTERMHKQMESLENVLKKELSSLNNADEKLNHRVDYVESRQRVMDLTNDVVSTLSARGLRGSSAGNSVSAPFRISDIPNDLTDNAQLNRYIKDIHSLCDSLMKSAEEAEEAKNISIEASIKAREALAVVLKVQKKLHPDSASLEKGKASQSYSPRRASSAHNPATGELRRNSHKPHDKKLSDGAASPEYLDYVFPTINNESSSTKVRNGDPRLGSFRSLSRKDDTRGKDNYQPYQTLPLVIVDNADTQYFQDNLPSSRSASREKGHTSTTHPSMSTKFERDKRPSSGSARLGSSSSMSKNKRSPSRDRDRSPGPRPGLSSRSEQDKKVSPGSARLGSSSSMSKNKRPSSRDRDRSPGSRPGLSSMSEQDKKVSPRSTRPGSSSISRNHKTNPLSGDGLVSSSQPISQNMFSRLISFKNFFSSPSKASNVPSTNPLKSHGDAKKKATAASYHLPPLQTPTREKDLKKSSGLPSGSSAKSKKASKLHSSKRPSSVEELMRDGSLSSVLSNLAPKDRKKDSGHVRRLSNQELVRLMSDISLVNSRSMDESSLRLSQQPKKSRNGSSRPNDKGKRSNGPSASPTTDPNAERPPSRPGSVHGTSMKLHPRPGSTSSRHSIKGSGSDLNESLQSVHLGPYRRPSSEFAPTLSLGKKRKK
ncbi:unnamed protein product [Phytomonas sp. EM1]|nr:unnamed protein product [Phytomonas sp. EM1]|eukprot:CCW63442.1 unnamed protein product [Phytomonas sp. isolate EM1]